MSSSRSSSAEAGHRRKHLPKSLGGNNTPYIAALRGSLLGSSSAHLAYQAFREPLAAIGISAADLHQDGLWHDNPPIRSPFQQLKRAATPARPGMTARTGSEARTRTKDRPLVVRAC